MREAKEASASKRERSWLIRAGSVLSFVAALSGLAWMVTTAVKKVRGGEELETYRTAWLVEFNWIGFLIWT
jgi:hypothetical protein